MVNITSPITIVKRSITVPANPAVTITDSAKTKTVVARIEGTSLPLTLWSGDAYDQIGNWTQDQAEARINELLGDKPEDVIKTLVI
jgi:hypothetical protein